MTRPRSRTHQALEENRRALVDAASAETCRARGDILSAAHYQDRAAFGAKVAAQLLAASDAAPAIAHGEVVPESDSGKALGLRDTLGTPDMPAIDASIARTDLLLSEHLDVAAAAIDAATSMEARSPLEKMLAHQMALTHACAFRFMHTAMDYLGRANGSGTAAAEAARLTNAACRLMDAYRQALLAIQRLRTGGTQMVTVQHVHVGEGAQAVIGNVQTGGAPQAGGREK